MILIIQALLVLQVQRDWRGFSLTKVGTEDACPLHGLVIRNILCVVVIQVGLRATKQTDPGKVEDHDDRNPRLPETEAGQLPPQLVVGQLGPRLFRPEEAVPEHPGKDRNQGDAGHPGDGKTNAENAKGPNAGKLEEHQATEGQRQAQGTDQNPVAQVVNDLSGRGLAVRPLVDQVAQVPKEPEAGQQGKQADPQQQEDRRVFGVREVPVIGQVRCETKGGNIANENGQESDDWRNN